MSLPSSQPPTLDLKITVPHKVMRVDVVKDKEYVYTREAGGTTVEFDYQDNDTKPGETYYYVRVFQRDPEKPEGDPEIGWASPFFVTYE